MQLISKIQAAILAGFVASATPLFGDESGNVDFTMPDLSPQTEQSTYIDRQAVSRTNCRGHPHRPGWVMVHERGLEWKRELATQWRQIRAARMLLPSDSCTCDMLYPDWEEARTEIEAIWAPFEGRVKIEWDQSMRDHFRSLQNLHRTETRGYFLKVGRLCANPE